MKRIISLLAVSVLSIMMFAGIASAHVVVYPKEAIQGTFEKFTVRVPTEKEVPTVKLEVKIPADVDISKFSPVPGWKYDITKDSSGKITAVVWSATGDGLGPTEFGEFSMQGKIGKDTKAIVWKAIQTYKDGSVVEWIGDDKSDTPASVTTVNPVPANEVVAPDGDMDMKDPSSNSNSNSNTNSSSNLPLYFSIAALVLSIIALFFNLLRPKKS